MLKRIKLSQEQLLQNIQRNAQLVSTWPAWKRNIFGGIYIKSVVDGKVKIQQTIIP